jgi:hypothetical protein
VPRALVDVLFHDLRMVNSRLAVVDEEEESQALLAAKEGGRNRVAASGCAEL